MEHFSRNQFSRGQCSNGLAENWIQLTTLCITTPPTPPTTATTTTTTTLTIGRCLAEHADTTGKSQEKTQQTAWKTRHRELLLPSKQASKQASSKILTVVDSQQSDGMLVRVLRPDSGTRVMRRAGIVEVLYLCIYIIHAARKCLLWPPSPPPCPPSLPSHTPYAPSHLPSPTPTPSPLSLNAPPPAAPETLVWPVIGRCLNACTRKSA